MPAAGRSWLAYRMRGAKLKKYEGVIHAHCREEAEAKAYAVFGAVTQTEKAKVYVQET